MTKDGQTTKGDDRLISSVAREAVSKEEQLDHADMVQMLNDLQSFTKRYNICIWCIVYGG